MLREASLYFKSVLVEDKKTGRLVTVPAYSPEHGPRTMGNTYEQSLIWQLFNDTIEAANILGKDGEFAGELQNAIEKLNPIEIGESGQIKECIQKECFECEKQSHFPHLSHLQCPYKFLQLLCQEPSNYPHSPPMATHIQQDLCCM